MILERGRKLSALKVVLYGPEGIGKSTFAAQFPNPVFIDTEGSTDHMDVARTPRPQSWTELRSHIDYFIRNPHEAGTLIIDTADWAEKLCTEQLIAENINKGVKGIEDFGYGKGYIYVMERFGAMLNQLDQLREKGVHIVLTAHAMMRKFEQPDEMGAYDRWELKLSKKISPLVKEWADMLLFANHKTYIINVDGQGAQKGKNKATGGKRVMYTTHYPCWDAKNRFGLPDEVPFEFASIAHLVQNIQPAGGTPAPAEKVTLLDAAKSAAKSMEDRNIDASPSPAAQPDPLELRYPGIPTALAALMAANDVKDIEIQTVAAQRGYVPADMPVRNYPADFVQGWCIGFWPQILEAIKANRENMPF